MSDPTDYRRKLAEAIEQAFCDWHGSDDTRNLLDVFLAVLASEGVVDPDEVRNLLAVINRDGGHRAGEFPDLNAAVADAHKQAIDRIAEVERLEKFIAQRSIKSRAIGISLGMEQAAKKCDEIDESDVAAAIRAEKANVE